jgi:hypothetical protein
MRVRARSLFLFRKDGNPLGWLALGRTARGRGFGGQMTFIVWRGEIRHPTGADGFIEPNKTVK